jgi:hypothetical protein
MMAALGFSVDERHVRGGYSYTRSQLYGRLLYQSNVIIIDKGFLYESVYLLWALSW